MASQRSRSTTEVGPRPGLPLGKTMPLEIESTLSGHSLEQIELLKSQYYQARCRVGQLLLLWRHIHDRGRQPSPPRLWVTHIDRRLRELFFRSRYRWGALAQTSCDLSPRL